MKTVKDRFMKAPYGFVEDDVHWLVARLFKRGDLAFTVSGASVTLMNKPEEEIIGYITKKAFTEKLLMEERIRVSDKDKKAVRDVMKELFHGASSAEDEDTVMKTFQCYSENTVNEIERLESEYCAYQYPGREVLDTGKDLLQPIIQIQTPLEFFQTVSRRQDEFYEFAEDYEPVKAFFGGEQKEIFTRVLDVLAIYEDSKTYIVDQELEDVVAQLRFIVRRPSPYRDIPKLPELRDKFTNAYMKVLDAEFGPVLDTIDQARARVLEVLKGKEYEEEKRQRYLEQFAEIQDGAEHCNNVSHLRGFADKADALKIRLLNEMDALDAQIAQEKVDEEAKRRQQAYSELGSSELQVAEQKTEWKVRTTRNISMKKVAGTSSWRLESAEDVERYVSELRRALLEQMDENTIINVEL